MTEKNVSTNRELLTAPEAAELAGVAVQTVRRQSVSGGFPSPVRIGRAVRWRRSELMQWISAGCPMVDDGGAEK